MQTVLSGSIAVNRNWRNVCGAGDVCACLCMHTDRNVEEKGLEIPEEQSWEAVKGGVQSIGGGTGLWWEQGPFPPL